MYTYDRLVFFEYFDLFAPVGCLCFESIIARRTAWHWKDAEVRIGIITHNATPFRCGIGDHSIHLAKALRLRGETVVIIAGTGNVSDDIHVVECDWRHQDLERLYRKLEFLELDVVCLQFTPLMYSPHSTVNRSGLEEFWKRCSQRWNTAIILHETYFRTWWYPRSWINGSREKRLLKGMVEHSQYVFSASQPLVEEITGWRGDAKTALLPIGSNFPFAKQDRTDIRTERGIGDDEIVLTLFGGGNAVKWLSGHVDAVDAILTDNNISIRWVLLGGVPAEWFDLSSEVHALGRIPEVLVSEWLQVADIFLVPHYAGLSGKRGTLMAAMQHSLPVVGTRTAMTDSFWSEVRGVKLVPMPNRKAFAGMVLELAASKALRDQCGASNRAYFEKCFEWQQIAATFLRTVQ